MSCARYSFSVLVFLAAILPLASASFFTINGVQYKVDQIITKDIAIVGGGSSGTYSAVQLKDLGKSVVVIEQTGRLGGHVNTFHGPSSGTFIDYGVQVFHKFDIAKNYFDRLNVSVVIGGDPGAELGVLT